jgi:hypothetical protein
MAFMTVWGGALACGPLTLVLGQVTLVSAFWGKVAFMDTDGLKYG